MTKKRKRSSGNKAEQNTYVDVNPCSTSKDFVYDEVDDFHKEKEDQLLSAGKAYKKDVNEDIEEVLGVASDSDDDDERAADYEKKLKRLGGVGYGALTDSSDDEDEVNEAEEDMLGSDVEDEDLEEHEAMRIQKNSLKYLNEDDFFGFSTLQVQSETMSKNSEVDEKAEKKKIKVIDSDEYYRVAEELNAQLKQLKQLSEESNELSAKQKAKAQLLLIYCMNMNFFLAMKSSDDNVQNHPVIGRICQFKKTIDNFESFFKIVKSVNKDGVQESEMEGIETDEQDGLHRPINKTIIQNRGIVPYRKKEYKNPRVRHRIKYRKAKIRRKGQFAEPRKEINKYQGELTGINPGIVRSIKFK